MRRLGVRGWRAPRRALLQQIDELDLLIATIYLRQRRTSQLACAISADFSACSAKDRDSSADRRNSSAAVRSSSAMTRSLSAVRRSTFVSDPQQVGTDSVQLALLASVIRRFSQRLRFFATRLCLPALGFGLLPMMA